MCEITQHPEPETRSCPKSEPIIFIPSFQALLKLCPSGRLLKRSDLTALALIPAKAGIQKSLKNMDSCLHWKDYKSTGRTRRDSKRFFHFLRKDNASFILVFQCLKVRNVLAGNSEFQIRAAHEIVVYLLLLFDVASCSEPSIYQL